MKRSFIILFFILSSYALFSQTRSDTLLSLVISKVDSLQVHNQIVEKAVSTITQTKKTWLENNGAWLVALIIGISTVIANIIINYQLRNTNRKSISDQIKSSENIAINSIQNSQELAFTQFKSTLKTKNRQDWINDMRNSLSELATSCKVLNIQFQNISPDEALKQLLHEKVTYNKTKLFLLLNPNISNHKNLLDAIDDLMLLLDNHFFNSKQKDATYDNLSFMRKTEKVIETGRQLAYEEWQKIQEILK